MKAKLVGALIALSSSGFGGYAAAPALKVQIVNKSSIDAGNIYLLLTGNPVAASGLTPGTPTLLSALPNGEFTLTSATAGRLYISYQKAVASNESPTSTTRFDKVEFTYPGAANLTAVDFLGIPFQLTTQDSTRHTLQELSFYASANTLAKKLTALAPKALITANGQPSGAFVRMLSPVKSPASYPSMQAYVSSLSGKVITIAGTYVGFVAPSPNTYSYSGTFASDGSITLRGTMSAAAVPNAQPLSVAGATLANAIYTCDGPYNVANASNNPQRVSNNDVYAAIYAAFIGGFNFGDIGGKYAASSSGWYGTTPYHPPYAAARAGNDGHYNKYAALIAESSDAYGFPFSDLLQPVQVALNPAASGPHPVETLIITILPDNGLDAPMITSASTSAPKSSSSTDCSITLSWGAVAGATGYTVKVSPPLPAQTFTTTQTTYKASGLRSGTPYTVAVAATKGAVTSAAMPVVISTSGPSKTISGKVSWNFIPNFTGTFGGHKITVNGITQTLPHSANPALQFNGIPGVAGQQNAYVFTWEDASGHLVYRSVLYVTLDATPSSGAGAINQATAATFLAANQNAATYAAGAASNLFLSLQPSIQRTVFPLNLAPLENNRPAVFSSGVKAHAFDHKTRVNFVGAVRDADEIKKVILVAITRGGVRKTYGTRFRGNTWSTNVRRLGSHVIKLQVIAEDRAGHRQTRRYTAKVL